MKKIFVLVGGVSLIMAGSAMAKDTVGRYSPCSDSKSACGSQKCVELNMVELDKEIADAWATVTSDEEKVKAGACSMEQCLKDIDIALELECEKLRADLTLAEQRVKLEEFNDKRIANAQKYADYAKAGNAAGTVSQLDLCAAELHLLHCKLMKEEDALKPDMAKINEMKQQIKENLAKQLQIVKAEYQSGVGGVHRLNDAMVKWLRTEIGKGEEIEDVLEADYELYKEELRSGSASECDMLIAKVKMLKQELLNEDDAADKPEIQAEIAAASKKIIDLRTAEYENGSCSAADLSTTKKDVQKALK